MQAGCTHHDEVDQRYGVEADVPEVHEAKQVAQDHADGHEDHDGRVEVKAQQNEGHHQDGTHADGQVGDGVMHNGQILLVEHVENAENIQRWKCWMHTNAHTVLWTVVHIPSTFSHVYQVSPLLSINMYDKCLTKILLWKYDGMDFLWGS